VKSRKTVDNEQQAAKKAKAVARKAESTNVKAAMSKSAQMLLSTGGMATGTDDTT